MAKDKKVYFFSSQTTPECHNLLFENKLCLFQK